MKIQSNTFAMTVLLATMTAIGPITMDIYLASMPHIGAALHAPTAQVQLTISFYVAGFAIGQIFYGPLSDAIGRRPMLLFGFALYIAATAVCAMATSVPMLIGARVVQALGAAGPIIIARAMVRDMFSGSQASRQFSLMSAITGIAPIGAPVLGGLLQAAFGWRSSFVAMCIIGLPLALCALLFLPETNRHKSGWSGFSPQAVIGSYRIVAADKTYLAYLTMMVISYCGVFAFLSSSSHVLQKVYHLGPREFGITFAICSFSYVIGNSSGTRLTPILRLGGMMRLGAWVSLAGGLLQLASYLLMPDQVFAIIIPQAIYFIGCGFLVPQLVAAALTPFPERAGAASSLMGCIQMGSAAVLGSLLGLVLGNSALPLVATVCTAGVINFFVYALTSDMRKQSRLQAQTRSL